MTDDNVAKAAIEAWLDGFEGFACRADRLGEDAATGRPLEPWLREAFKLGMKAERRAKLAENHPRQETSD